MSDVKRKHICNRKNIKKKDIEQYVINAISRLLNDEYAINKIIETAINYQQNDVEHINEIKDIESTIKEIERKISNILSAIEAGIFTDSTKNRLQELENQKTRLTQELNYKNQSSTKIPRTTLKQILKNLDLSKDATNPEKQNIIDLLIHRIYLWQDKILIVFNQSNLCDNEISVDDTDVNTIIKTLSEPNASSSDSVEYGTPDQSRTGD